jgi:predicted Fe-Mo cluster-binding NifX family protein
MTAGRLASHFGHCEEFALLDVDREHNRIRAVGTLEPPAHQPGVLPPWLAEQGAELVIAGGMGLRAQELFRAHGIEVIVGAPVLDAGALVTAYLEGTLETGDNACDH